MGASAVAQRVLADRAVRAFVLLSLLAAGCTAAQTTPASLTPSTSPGATAEPGTSGGGPSPDAVTARQTLESANPTDPDSIAAIEALLYTSAGEQGARDLLIGPPTDVDVTWAATWVYGTSATDPAPLHAVLQNADGSLRAMAAAGTIAMGDGAGFEVLRAALNDEDQLRGSQPPRSVATFAWACVSRYVVAAGIPAAPPDAEQLAAAKAAWADWLGQHAADLQFDAASGTWKLP